MAAVGPETVRDEAALEVRLRPAARDRAGGAVALFVGGFGGLVVPLLAVADVLAEDEAGEDGEEGVVRGGEVGLDAAGEEEGVGGRGGEGEEKDGLDEGDEGYVEEEEDPGGDVCADDFPAWMDMLDNSLEGQ